MDVPVGSVAVPAPVSPTLPPLIGTTLPPVVCMYALDVAPAPSVPAGGPGQPAARSSAFIWSTVLGPLTVMYNCCPPLEVAVPLGAGALPPPAGVLPVLLTLSSAACWDEALTVMLPPPSSGTV